MNIDVFCFKMKVLLYLSSEWLTLLSYISGYYSAREIFSCRYAGAHSFSLSVPGVNI